MYGRCGARGQQLRQGEGHVQRAQPAHQGSRPGYSRAHTRPNGAPTAGDMFNVLETEQEAREIANKREQLAREQGLRTTKMLTLEDIGRRRAIGNFQELNIIVKGDVDGSIEALSDSLIKLSTEEIQINVLHKAVGEISESDVTLAAASDAIIIGFQVRPSAAAAPCRRARWRADTPLLCNLPGHQEEVKDAMAEACLLPKSRRKSPVRRSAGDIPCVEGRHNRRSSRARRQIKRGCKVRLIRDGIVRYTGDLGSPQALQGRCEGSYFRL